MSLKEQSARNSIVFHPWETDPRNDANNSNNGRWKPSRVPSITAMEMSDGVGIIDADAELLLFRFAHFHHLSSLQNAQFDLNLCLKMDMERFR